MSWLFSRALVEEYSADICSGGEQSAPLKSIPTPQAYWSPGRTTDTCPRFRSGMTFARLTVDCGAAVLTSFREAFPVLTSARRGKVRVSKGRKVDYGVKWQGSFAKYDRDSSSWKTRQCLLVGDLEEFSETWPRWGSMRNGESYRRKTPSGLLEIRACITSVNVSGSLRVPTPTVQDKCRDYHNQRDGSKRESLLGFVRRAPTPTATDGRKWNAKTAEQRKRQGSSIRLCNLDRGNGLPIGGDLNPTWSEWLMGWPLNWTDITPLDMCHFATWNDSHEKEQWTEGCPTDVFGDRVRNLWWGEEPTEAPHQREPDRQYAGECVDSVPSMPCVCPSPDIDMREGACQGVDVPSLRHELPAKEITTGQVVRQEGMSRGERTPVGRTAVGVKNRVDRLRSIGNGQVPAVVALAWRILYQRLTGRKWNAN